MLPTLHTMSEFMFYVRGENEIIFKKYNGQKNYE